MVLLTSSAISVAISGAIVCAFTFLLFLSGYVLQQRTVRSLQEALRQPPEPKPIPTLPPQFAEAENLSTADGEQRIQEVTVGNDGGLRIEEALVALSIDEQSVQQTQLATNVNLWGATRTLDMLQATQANLLPTASPRPQDVLQTTERLAYILTLSEPSDLCSAALFAQQQRSSSTLSRKPAIIFLYPSTWESSLSPLHIATLTFLRDIQDAYSLIYHPVEINAVWSGVGINSQLLSELQRNRWEYDRFIYLKSPGMVMDTLALDKALAKSNLRDAWAPVSASTGHDPEMLFWSRKKGLLMARGETRKLTLSATTSHSNHHASELDMEVLAKSAAYVLFDEEELDHRRSEKEWYGGLFEKFERDRSGICRGRGLLHGEQDKVDLRRRG